MKTFIAVWDKMEKVEEMFGRIELKLHDMDGKLEYITKEMTALKLENKELKENAEKQEKRIELLEREVRRKNLVVKGVVDEEREGETDTQEKIVSVLQKIGVGIDVNNEVEEIRRIGRYEARRTRPILIKLVTFNKKQEVLKNATKLKGSDIWINEDYPREIQEERRKLFPKLKQAREKGYRAHIRYNKLIIDNKASESEDMRRDSHQAAITEGERDASHSIKRTVSERSPGESPLEKQLNKIAKTGKPKN